MLRGGSEDLITGGVDRVVPQVAHSTPNSSLGTCVAWLLSVPSNHNTSTHNRGMLLRSIIWENARVPPGIDYTSMTSAPLAPVDCKTSSTDRFPLDAREYRHGHDLVHNILRR